MPTSYSETTLNIQVNCYWLAMKEEFEPIENGGEYTTDLKANPLLHGKLFPDLLY